MVLGAGAETDGQRLAFVASQIYDPAREWTWNFDLGLVGFHGA